MEASMARPRRRPLQASDIEGLEYFDTLAPLLARLKDIGAERDRAGNRQLFYDQYVCLLLLYFFSPTITSLRALQQASTLEAVQRRLGIRATSLGSFSEAARLFDAEALHQILQELAAKAAGQWTRRAPVARSHRRRRQYLSRVSAHGMGPVERLRTSRRQAALALRRLLRNSPGCFHYPRLWLGNGSAAGHAAARTPVRH